MRAHPSPFDRHRRARRDLGRKGALIVALLLACAVAAILLPKGALTLAAPRSGGDRVTLQQPFRGSVQDESNVLLGWSPDRRASEYVVFVSRQPLEGRSLESLQGDAGVSQARTRQASMRLQDVVRGAPGTTTWWWAVAARERTSGRLVLSEAWSFDAVKTFQGGAPRTQLVSEVGRGHVQAAANAAAVSVLLANGMRFDPKRDGEPRVAPAMKAGRLSPTDVGSFLVQLSGPVQAGWPEEIVAAGATLFAYLPDYTFLVRVPAEGQATLARLPFVRWVGAYHPAYKLSPQHEMSKAAGSTALVVLLFPDADLATSNAAVLALGGRVIESTDSGRNKLLRVDLDMSRVQELALRQDVAWIEPWHELHVFNNSAQWVVQTNISNNRRVWDMGLHGEGQVMHTSDSGIHTTHYAFRDAAVPIATFGNYPTHRKIIAYQPAMLNAGILFDDTPGASYHGTHTAGTVVGDDSPFAADLRDGMALKAKIYFTDAGASSNTIIAPSDLNLLFQPPYDGNAGGAARISSNSWGSDEAGAYTVESMTADQFMWDHKDFLINFSNGNAGASGAGTVGSPASFKDGISSGASGNGTLSGDTASFSSRGPCDDGRLKPTIMSPGDPVLSANGAGDTGYKSMSGTSMSCPAGAGAITLIRQYLTDGWYPTGGATPANAFVPSAALLKAMAIASTDNDMTSQTIPNNTVGWGRIKVDNILYFAGDAARTAVVDQTDGLVTGDWIDYEINVSGTSVPLKIALCWTDKEGSPAAARAIVNDVDLTVTDPGSTAYLGNVFSSGQSATGGTRDSLNVEENARRTTPAAGTWRIRVRARNVPFGPQPFALAVSGGIGGNNGIVQLDRTTYGRDDVIEVRVEDLNASSPIQVLLTSSTETAPESLSIAGTGVFTATFPTTALEAAHGDGKLSVSHGDAIQVLYNDASPALALHAAATADFTGPVISAVGSNEDDVTEHVVWITDTPASSRVYYGTTPALGQVSNLDPELVTAHDVLLSGLLPETTYWYDVESKDHAGNSTRDDAGGGHSLFTTGKKGDVLVVIGDNSFTRSDVFATALANRGWDASFLKGGTISNPVVGDLGAGLRSYLAVWWQVGYEQYPPFEDAARDSLTAYLSGGGRLSVTTHDAAWAFSDATSGYYSTARKAWLESDLHVHWLEDPATWALTMGLGGDPISGGYTAGIAYTPFRSGGAGDEVSIVNGTGSGAYIWRDNDTTPDNVAVRWQNGAPNGNPANAVWGGTPTKVVTNCFEWAQLTNVTAREDVLDKTLIWLVGRDHPDAAITAPNGGETISADSTTIVWTETAYGGAGIASRALYASADGGSSWTLITNAAGPSPYAWDVSGLPNAASYRLRIAVRDDGSPALRGGDLSDASFKIARAGGDTRGPVVVAGSMASSPNPMHNHFSSTLSATVTDVGRGDANVAAAEWSEGASPAAAGSGHAMSGSFGTPTAGVSANVGAGIVPAGERTFWVRGQDANGIWGSAKALGIRVNGDVSVDAEASLPRRHALFQNFPNPFNPTTLIRYDLPQAGDVRLDIYDVRGTRVRRLVAGRQQAGSKSVAWDGRDEGGHALTSGVYLYHLRAGKYAAARKMLLLK